MFPTRRARAAALSIAMLALVFLAGIVVAPWAESTSPRWAGALLRMCYAPLCHQLEGRSLHLGAAPLAVCARCTGLYVGGACGLWLGALAATGLARRVRPAWLAGAAVPTVLDAGAGWAGMPALPEIPRMLVAIPPGAVAGALLALAVIEVADRRRPAAAAGWPSAIGRPRMAKERVG